MSASGHGAVVLMYHRVTAVDRDPLATSVAPDHFAQHLEVLRALAEVGPVASMREPSARARVAITFDDGYTDNLEVAYPMLEDAGLPATVFVATDGMYEPQEFWWDQLEHLLLDMPSDRASVEVDLSGRHVTVDVRAAEGRRRALQLVQRHLAISGRAGIDAVLSQLRDQVGAHDGPCARHRRMTSDEVKELARSGLVDVGGHTCSHTMLSAQTSSAQWEEIAGSKQALERVLGRPVTAFAYPFGVMGSSASATARLVRRAGYRFACTTHEGRVTRFTNRYRIPRIEVLDWDGDEFGRRVISALAA